MRHRIRVSKTMMIHPNNLRVGMPYRMDFYLFNSSDGYGWVFLTESLLIHEFIWIVGHRDPQRLS